MTDADAILAASRASIDASARLHEAADRLARALEAGGQHPGAGNTATVTLAMGGGGVGLWVAATAALLALVVTHMQGQRVTDAMIAQQGLRQEVATAIAAERNSRERFETWAAEEANTLRTFARTGVLAPMKPRPADTQEPTK
jgi:hypothetical protein